MRPLTAEGLLTAWERGQELAPAARALLLLSLAAPEASEEWLMSLTVGQRDAGLLTLRQWLFGAELTSLAYCPQCGEPLEFAAPVTALLLDELPALAVAAQPATFVETLDGFTVRFRLPTAGDMLSLTAPHAAGREHRLLLEECLISIQQGENEVTPAEAPEPVITAVVARMAEADPQADVRFDLTCPHCETAWSPPFDIVSFFWSEIDSWARRIVQEVHLLARAYGWSEAEILALSPLRRQLYLEQI
jgi:hypothetical protein